MLRALGVDHRWLKATLGLAFVVKSCRVDYHRPAHLDDLLDIQSIPKRLRGASLDLAQRICLDDRLLVSLDVRLALLDGAMKPARVPSSLIAALRPQYGPGN
jgi:acyl-CoA thioester hydrolase